MAKAAKPFYTEEQVEHATEGWHSFMNFAKWGSIAVIVLLIGMATFLL